MRIMKCDVQIREKNAGVVHEPIERQHQLLRRPRVRRAPNGARDGQLLFEIGAPQPVTNENRPIPRRGAICQPIDELIIKKNLFYVIVSTATEYTLFEYHSNRLFSWKKKKK